MKSVLRILARLYPTSWRARYGAEFDALLEDAKPSPRQVLDVFLGAMNMQITTWNFGKIVAVSAVVGLVVASVGAFLGPAQYDSSCNVEIYGSDKAAQSSIDSISRVVLSRESLAAVIQRYNLYPGERGHESPDQLVTRMEKAVSLHSVKGNPPVRNVTLDFKYSDPKVAQEVNAELVQRIMQDDFKMAMASPDGPRHMAVVSEIPSLPLTPSGPAEYDSSAKVEIYGSDNAAQSLIGNIFKSTLSRESLASFIERHNLYQGERGHESLDQLVTRMEKAIMFQSAKANPSDAPGVRTLTLDFKYSDPRIAQQVDGDLVSQIVTRNLTTAEASPNPYLTFRVWDAPGLPLKPSGPGWAVVSAVGTMAGALCGLVFATLMGLKRRRSASAP